MPKQSSVIKFTGKMDGISFYERKGVHFARKANGPSKSRILTDPKFERTRENLSEFAGLALATSSFTQMLSVVKTMKDGQFRNGLVGVMRSVNKQSGGIRGQRGILISKNRKTLKNLELNTELKLSEVFTGKIKTTHDVARNKATFTLTDLVVNNVITPPPTATHFRLVQLVGIVSDLVYNVNLKKYEAVDEANNSLSNATFTDYMPVRGTQPITITLDTTIENDGPLTENVSVVQGFGILFFEKADNDYYLLGQGRAMRIVDVF